MARRRTDQGIGILIVFVAIVFAVAFLGPFAIVGWSVFNEMRSRRLSAQGKDLLGERARIRAAGFRAKLANLEKAARGIHTIGDDEGLLRRMDASRFDGRSFRGRHLNQTLEDIEAQYWSVAESRDTWLSARSGLVAARVALVTFIAVFIFIAIDQAPPGSMGFGLSRLMFGIAGDGASRVAASVGASVAAGVVGWLGGAITRATLPT